MQHPTVFKPLGLGLAAAALIALPLAGLAATEYDEGAALQGGGALNQGTQRDGAMSGGEYVQDAPNERAQNTLPQREPRGVERGVNDSVRRGYGGEVDNGTLPNRPEAGITREGYDNDNDFVGDEQGVTSAPPNTNPDRRQLEQSFDIDED